MKTNQIFSKAITNLQLILHSYVGVTQLENKYKTGGLYFSVLTNKGKE